MSYLFREDQWIAAMRHPSAVFRSSMSSIVPRHHPHDHISYKNVHCTNSQVAFKIRAHPAMRLKGISARRSARRRAGAFIISAFDGLRLDVVEEDDPLTRHTKPDRPCRRRRSMAMRDHLAPGVGSEVRPIGNDA